MTTVPQIEDWDGTCAGLWQVTATDGLWLRETPGGDKITLLPAHTVVYVWCASGPWYLVQTTDAIAFRTGWSHSTWLQPMDSQDGARAGWNVRPTVAMGMAAWKAAQRALTQTR